jgi:chromosome segregation ATPase
MLSTRSFIALALASLASCNAPSHLRAVKTADRLEELRASIEELRNHVTATSTAFAALVSSKDQDPTQAYEQLENAVHALDTSRRRAEGQLHGVHEEADAYFLTWKEQAATISDEDLKEASEDRRAELAKAVERVEESMKPVRESLDAYEASLHDTMKYLSIDLAPPAIASIEGRSKSTTKSAKGIQDKLGDVLESLKDVAPLFATARTTSAPKRIAPEEPPSN